MKKTDPGVSGNNNAGHSDENNSVPKRGVDPAQPLSTGTDVQPDVAVRHADDQAASHQGFDEPVTAVQVTDAQGADAKGADAQGTKAQGTNAQGLGSPASSTAADEALSIDLDGPGGHTGSPPDYAQIPDSDFLAPDAQDFSHFEVPAQYDSPPQYDAPTPFVQKKGNSSFKGGSNSRGRGGAGGHRSSSDRDFIATRIPPHSIESEQALIGAMMLSGTAFEQVADQVVEVDFYQHNHRVIYRAIAALTTDSSPTDVVTVTGWLEKHSLLEEASGIHYVAALAQESPSAANAKAYAGIIRERSVLRQLIGASTEIADAAFEPEGRDSKDLLDFAETRVFSIADQTNRAGDGFADIKSVLGRAVDRISYLFESGEAITGLGTGFTELDEKTSGLQPSDLIIVAGRPSMGKTTFAMNIAEHAALAGDQPIAIFSLEMPAEQLAMRMISSIGRVELQKLRTGKLSEQDWPRITSAITLLNAKKNVFIDDTPSLTPTDLRARARRLKREHNGLGLIVIDYLQLMRVVGTAENKATEIAEISRSLKALAKELEVPVVALSQLNRSLEQRPDKRPIMSDLRESGAIEQDADVIMFIYRDEVYNPDLEESKGKAEVLIRKQRNGPIGSLMLTFLGQYTRFENYSPELQHGSGVNEANF